MKFQATLLFLAWTSFITDVKAQCAPTESHIVDSSCVDLVTELQSAILDESNNRFVLVEVFYPESKVEPILVQVDYTLNFVNYNETDCGMENNTKVTLGWSRRSVYSYFHAAIVNQMRYQLPFWVMSFSYPLLSSEPSADALMWTGVNQSTLSVLPLNLTLNECYDQDVILRALYSVTTYLMIYADVSLNNDIPTQLEGIEVSHRAEALNEVMVSGHFEMLNFSVDQNADYGMKLFDFGYVITFILIIFAQIFFTIMLLSPLKEVFVAERECDWSRTKCMITSFIFISLFVNFITYVVELHMISNLGFANAYIWYKFIFLMVLLFLCLSVPFLILPFQLDFTSKHILKDYILLFISLFTITLFLSTIMLSTVPYLILMFAYPVDTSVLLTLHYAILYSYTNLFAILLRFFSENWYSNQAPAAHTKASLLLHQASIDEVFHSLQYACYGRTATIAELSRQLLHGQVDQNLVRILARIYADDLCHSVAEITKTTWLTLTNPQQGVDKFTKHVAEECCRTVSDTLALDFYQQLTENVINKFIKQLLQLYPKISILLLDQKVKIDYGDGDNQAKISQLVTTTGKHLKKSWKKAASLVPKLVECHFGGVVDELTKLLSQIILFIQPGQQQGQEQGPQQGQEQGQQQGQEQGQQLQQNYFKRIKLKAAKALKSVLTQEQDIAGIFATLIAMEVVKYNERNFSREVLRKLSEKFTESGVDIFQNEMEELTKCVKEQLPLHIYQHLSKKQEYTEVLGEGTFDAFKNALSKNRKFASFIKKSATVFVQHVCRNIVAQYKKELDNKNIQENYSHSCKKITKELLSMGYYVFSLLLSLPLFSATYVFMMLMYLILIGRYNFSSDVTKALSALIPSILVVLSTHYLKRYVFRPQKNAEVN